MLRIAKWTISDAIMSPNKFTNAIMKNDSDATRSKGVIWRELPENSCIMSQRLSEKVYK